jgi:hypothetical protein
MVRKLSASDALHCAREDGDGASSFGVTGEGKQEVGRGECPGRTKLNIWKPKGDVYATDISTETSECERAETLGLGTIGF